MSNRVTIRPVAPAGPGIVFELAGDDDVSGGVGGWEQLDRARRTTAVYWRGTPARTWSLPLLIDGMETRVGVDTVIETQCTRLDSWGRSSRRKRVTVAPPVLQVIGPVQMPATSRWVLQGLTWGERVRNAAGRRIQQYVTLDLLEYVEPTLVKSYAKKSRSKGKK